MPSGKQIRLHDMPPTTAREAVARGVKSTSCTDVRKTVSIARVKYKLRPDLGDSWWFLRFVLIPVDLYVDASDEVGTLYFLGLGPEVELEDLIKWIKRGFKMLITVEDKLKDVTGKLRKYKKIRKIEKRYKKGLLYASLLDRFTKTIQAIPETKTYDPSDTRWKDLHCVRRVDEFSDLQSYGLLLSADLSLSSMLDKKYQWKGEQLRWLSRLDGPERGFAYQLMKGMGSQIPPLGLYLSYLDIEELTIAKTGDDEVLRGDVTLLQLDDDSPEEDLHLADLYNEISDAVQSVMPKLDLSYIPGYFLTRQQVRTYIEEKVIPLTMEILNEIEAEVNRQIEGISKGSH